jgi:hypothetical protein
MNPDIIVVMYKRASIQSLVFSFIAHPKGRLFEAENSIVFEMPESRWSKHALHPSRVKIFVDELRKAFDPVVYRSIRDYSVFDILLRHALCMALP